MLSGVASLLHLLHPLILRCWPQRGTWVSLWVKKDIFQTLFPSWSLPGSSPLMMPSSDRFRCTLASQWEVSASLGKASWILERTKKTSFLCAACYQTDAYPMGNKSIWYKRRTGNCFSTTIFKGRFLSHLLSRAHVAPEWSALQCTTQIVPIMCCFLWTSSMFGDLVPYDKMAHGRRSSRHPPPELWSIIQLIHQLMDQMQRLPDSMKIHFLITPRVQKSSFRPYYWLLGTRGIWKHLSPQIQERKQDRKIV